MSEEDRYRRYAKFCREQASLFGRSEAERWLHLAVEYERLADVASGMDADGIPPCTGGTGAAAADAAAAIQDDPGRREVV